ncbi:PucR family transcriptional regulator [Bacillus canaveralius]|uniref:PucR family transcriptional regulator n=1 Tax=Bacillus canaveralius TaxID=1403243 RepID=UPI000F77ECCA|nr:helix-turn-helix domain-containing protein [Bacillus canaveralius]RSK51549.1 hypothetical protein EJA13_14225 [Bacillus canaveralius]
MFKQLLSLYPGAVLASNPPDQLTAGYNWFLSPDQDEWIGIPQKNLSEKELDLLNALFGSFGQPAAIYRGYQEQSWHDFLFAAGKPPASDHAPRRMIQFQFKGESLNKNEMKPALKGFFADDCIVIWLGDRSGLVIEDNKGYIMGEDDFHSLANTLESDFYIKTYFYLGKFLSINEEMSRRVQYEAEFFQTGIKLLTKERIYTFEKVFPALLSASMPENLRRHLTQQILPVFQEEPEMLHTIKVFLENNLNASLTAKKLYIHRNTLQYRIDKFTDKTGISLKDFNGAITVYIACYLYELS